MKVETAISNACLELKKKSIRSPLLDSEILMAKVFNKSREFVLLNSKEIIKQKHYFYFQKLIEERLRGKPVAYIIGKKSFWKYDFDINENVLIPRPDTEIIVEQVLKIYKNKEKINFLDVGTGSGCISLSILKEKKDFLATGVDINNHCFKICKINALKLGVQNRFRFIKTDIDNLYKNKYDLIISNPPYIKKIDLKYLDRDVKDYEPLMALDGGLDGLSKIRKVVNKSSDLIRKNGKLILEIAFNQKFDVKKILTKKGFYINKIIKDFAMNDRCIISTKI